MRPQAAWATMQEAIRNAGRPGVGAMAVSAVDVALWDLEAKLLDVCLADLLPRFHETAPVYGSGGFTSYSDRRLAKQLGGWVEMGIPRVKMKVGREPERDPHRLRVAREAIGVEVDLFVDANGAFTPTQALRWADRYAGFGVSYFEEPVSSDDRAGLRRVRDRAPAGMAIAAGEYGWTLTDLAGLTGCVDVLQADVTRCGGITNLLRVDGICKGAELPFSAHCAPAISAHACCAVECLVHLEYFHDHVRVERLLFDGTLDPSAGALRPDSSRPGLGIGLKRAEAARYEL
jgi:L-alanine-DL-glutamate epimerase-like enolase superfamily enzyme